MIVRVENLCRSFRKVPALSQVTFTLPPGRVYGFVGPNGAGKTTTLRIMAGLDQPDAGDVWFDDVSVVEYPEQAFARAGFMPDSLPDAGDIAVWEYLDFFARAHGLRETAKREAVARVAEYTNLAGLSEKMLSELSKGMKQQVSLARVLLHDPEILLLDEPAAGLDPRARIDLRETLRKLACAGKTVFISSHILSDLDEIADGVIVIEKGVIVNSGEISELNARVSAERSVVRVLLLFAGAAAGFAELLKGFPGVRQVTLVSTRQMELEISGGEAEFRGLMRQIFDRDALPVIGMSRPDLGIEDVFMRVTRGEVQ